MGRGRVQLKRIENNISRQVTFSKRRTGLVKKAKEISILCDADVGLIVFSSNGKLCEFSTDSCMESILERYERYTCAEKNVVPAESKTRGSWSVEHTKLTARIEVLQKNISHLVRELAAKLPVSRFHECNLAGEGLDPLKLKELQYLEQQLDNALRRIRNRKNQLMHESIAELRKKEKCLQDQNSLLAKKLHGNEKDLTEQQIDWNHHHHYQQQQDLTEPQNLTSAAAFMLPKPLAHPSLSIGRSCYVRESVDDNSRTHTRPVMTSIPSWMLSNLNG